MQREHPTPSHPAWPADTTHPRRALARLALSYTYYEVADFAAGGVPTVSDEYGDPHDYIDHAVRLLAIARDVLARAVVYARERGGTWTAIAETLDVTAEQARDQYGPTVDQWDDALDRPWERSGQFLASRMPDGTTDPDQTAADLDQWCRRHLDENNGTRHNARHDGIEDRMVSANLPQHTPLTELNSLTRTAAYLIQRGTQVTTPEPGIPTKPARRICWRSTAKPTAIDCTSGSTQQRHNATGRSCRVVKRAAHRCHLRTK